MPNEVYDAAVEGLGALVSPRVAKRILDDALHATNRTPDDVSRSAMRRLLLGRIRKDLEGVMPAGALGPGLKHLAAALDNPSRRDARPWWRGGARSRPTGARSAGSDAVAGGNSGTGAKTPRGPERGPRSGAVPGEAGTGAGGSTAGGRGMAPGGGDRLGGPQDERPAFREIGVTRSSVYLPDVPLPDLELPAAPRDLLADTAPAVVGAVPAPAARAAAAIAGASESAASAARSTAAAPPPTPRPPAPSSAPLPAVTQALVDRALRVFADLETVRQVVAVQRGIVLLASGEGVDPERLQGLSVAITALLSKAGTLRVFSLEHEAGVLFLFPMKDGAIVVLTRPKVNLGAVLSARATLEEAA